VRFWLNKQFHVAAFQVHHIHYINPEAGCACVHHNGDYLCAILNTRGCTMNQFINVTFKWHNKQPTKVWAFSLYLHLYVSTFNITSHTETGLLL